MAWKLRIGNPIVETRRSAQWYGRSRVSTFSFSALGVPCVVGYSQGRILSAAAVSGGLRVARFLRLCPRELIGCMMAF